MNKEEAEEVFGKLIMQGWIYESKPGIFKWVPKQVHIHNFNLCECGAKK